MLMFLAVRALRQDQFPPNDCVRQLRDRGSVLFVDWLGKNRLWPPGGWKRAYAEWFGIEDWSGEEYEGVSDPE